MDPVKAIVVSGLGITGDREMALAARLAGAEPQTVHVDELIEQHRHLDEATLLLFPGGFSFGDELGAGKVMANRAGRAFADRLKAFVDGGGCILGVCNGFQLLVKLGLLPGFDGTLRQQVALAPNESGRFENRWTYHHVAPSRCIFTKGLKNLYLPVRHGEGRFVAESSEVIQQLVMQRQITLCYADSKGQTTMSYPDNPDGSADAIAGICDETGRVLGITAHPEAYVMPTQHPRWSRQRWEQKKATPSQGDGLKIFQNAVEYLRATQRQGRPLRTTS